MIFTAKDPGAHKAQIWDKQGNNLCDKYVITWYNTETKMAGVLETLIDHKGRVMLKSDGLGGVSYKIVHLPGSNLVLAEPLKKSKL